MKVKRFRGKIFYPVMYEGDSAALGEVTVTTNRQKTVPVFEKSSVHCEEMRKDVYKRQDGRCAPERPWLFYTARSGRCAFSCFSHGAAFSPAAASAS